MNGLILCLPTVPATVSDKPCMRDKEAGTIELRFGESKGDQEPGYIHGGGRGCSCEAQTFPSDRGRVLNHCVATEEQYHIPNTFASNVYCILFFASPFDFKSGFKCLQYFSESVVGWGIELLLIL